MLTVSTYVAPSAIEGLGVFAGESIERGRLMWSLNPKFDIFVSPRRSKSCRRMCRTTSPATAIRIWRCPGCVVVDSDNGRFMNHSLTPNTDFRVFDKGYALVDIAQGDEITCNYHEFDPAFMGLFPNIQAAAVDGTASCQLVRPAGLALAA